MVTILIAAALPDIYGRGSERQIIAKTMENPAMVAMLGPVYGTDNYHDGAMMGNFMLLFTAMAVGIMSILTAAKHTREDEEEGRTEIIRSLPVGRLSNLAAMSLVLISANLIISLTAAFGLAVLDLDGVDLKGSLLYGFSLGATGIFFMALTALFAQLTSTNRGTIGYSFAFLIAAYLIRAMGDVNNSALSMLSPLGWILRTQVYVNNYWWPILLTLAASLALLAFAFYLSTLRDLGAGFIPPRPGSSRASRFLTNPLGLAIRLQRTSIISWLIGMFILGASYGSIFGDIEVFLGGSGMIAEMLPKVEGISLAETYLAFLFIIISIISAVPALITMLNLRSEEKHNRMEPLLARSVSRSNIMGSFLSISMAVSVLSQLLAVLGLWYAAQMSMDTPIKLATMLSSGLVYLPAIWVMIGIAVFLTGFSPHRTNLAWLYLGYTFIVVYLGNLLNFPEWMPKLSPYGHIPQLPIENFNLWSFIALTFLAVILMLLGSMGFRKRDLT
jgi:ABC-2 type transport system permease protein